MHKNVYNTHNRYRNRNRSQVRRLFMSIMFVLLVFLLGIWLGKGRAGGERVFLDAQVKEKTAQIVNLEEELMLSRSNAQTAEMRYTQLQNDVLKELPFDGPLRSLIEELRLRLDEGVNPERLSFAIKAARPPQNCTDPKIKRFVLSTPVYQGPDSKVEIDDNVFLTGEGSSAKNDKGALEAWYNPAKPVKVTIQSKDGKQKTKNSTLPFSDTMVVGDKEYRFTLSEGARSFVKVTYDHCDYP